MQGADTNRGGDSPNGDQERDMARYRQKYPARGHYIAGNRRPKAASGRLGQIFILVAAGFGALCLSFLAVIIREASQRETVANGDAAHFDKQYPEISDKVKRLAADLGLTEAGKKIFYEYDPAIFEIANHPDFICNKNVRIDQRIMVSGCWSANTGRIYLLNDDKLLLTAAHEFLHAVYYDFYIADRHEDLNILLNEAFNQNAEELQPLISVYSNLHVDAGEFSSLNRYNELHSFVGTQIEAIPDALEEHYATYFTDRTAIISIHNSSD